MSREKKNQNASKRGTIETSSLRFARSKPQKNQNASKRGTIETSSLRFARSKPQKKNVTIWASRSARAPNIGATACPAWALAETFNGLQKVLENVYIPDSKT